MDWDFPAPTPAPPPPPVAPLLAAPPITEYIAGQCLTHMGAFAKQDAEGVAWAAYDWLQINEAGMPVLPLIDGKAREDARFWAETAHPAELEAYALASIDRLAGSGGGHALFAGRQIKRLVGALWRRMSPAEQVAFAKWAVDQMKEGQK